MGDSLAAALKAVPGSDTAAGREQIAYIDLTALDADENNFYTLDGIDDLAANIELVGLQQPLRVRPSPDAPGRYIIVSGHRRRAALLMLAEEGREQFRAVPCIVEAPAASAAMQELRLIYANSATRKISPAALAKQAERVEMLLYQLREEGVEFPGRMRDHVAEACRVSKTKLATLKVIREKLIPEYMALFEQDALKEAAAYVLARFPEDFQRRIFRAVPEPPRAIALESVLGKYSEGWRWEPELRCPDGAFCRRGDVFLRRDCEAGCWQGLCGGRRCCLDCADAKTSCYPCERMCSKAKAQRKAAKAEAEEAAHKRQQKTGRSYQKKTQRHAKRLLRAIDDAGLAENAEIIWRTHYESYSVSTIRHWAAGEFDDPSGWYVAKLAPERCDNAAALAKKLGCSADYLLGLSDELRPGADGGARWMPGEQPPEKNCDAVCIFDAGGGIRIRQLARWVVRTWCFPGGATIDAKCLWWFALPEDPEEL